MAQALDQLSAGKKCRGLVGPSGRRCRAAFHLNCNLTCVDQSSSHIRACSGSSVARCFQPP